MTLTKVLDAIERALPDLVSQCERNGDGAEATLRKLDAVVAQGPDLASRDEFFDALLNAPQTPGAMIDALSDWLDGTKIVPRHGAYVDLAQYARLTEMVRNAFQQCPKAELESPHALVPQAPPGSPEAGRSDSNPEGPRS